MDFEFPMARLRFPSFSHVSFSATVRPIPVFSKIAWPPYQIFGIRPARVDRIGSGDHIRSVQFQAVIDNISPSLVKQHLGYVGALQKVYNATGFPGANVFAHPGGPENWSRADIWCTRLQVALCVFSVSTGILCLRKFGGRTNAPVFTNPKRVSHDRLGWRTMFESKNGCYK